MPLKGKIAGVMLSDSTTVGSDKRKGLSQEFIILHSKALGEAKKQFLELSEPVTLALS